MLPFFFLFWKFSFWKYQKCDRVRGVCFRVVIHHHSDDNRVHVQKLACKTHHTLIHTLVICTVFVSGESCYFRCRLVSSWCTVGIQIMFHASGLYYCVHSVLSGDVYLVVVDEVDLSISMLIAYDRAHFVTSASPSSRSSWITARMGIFMCLP